MFRDRMLVSRRAYAAAMVLTGVLVLAQTSWTALNAAASMANGESTTQDEPPLPSGCEPVTSYVADSKPVPAGETVGLTLTVSAGCPDRTPAVHVAVVIDGTTGRSELEDVKDSAKRWLAQIVKDSHPNSYATVVEFRGSARRVCPLTNDSEDLVTCLNKVRLGSGSSRSDLGIKEAVATLRRARTSVDEGRQINEAFMLYTNAKEEDCSLVEREAIGAAKVGIHFGVRCASGRSDDCDRECLADVGRHNEGPITGAYVIPVRIAPLRLLAVLVTDTFASNMHFVEGSARPAPSSIAPDRSAVQWNASSITSKIFNLRLRPQEEGVWPVSDGPVHGSFVDYDGGFGTFEFEIPSIEVLPRLEVPTEPPTATSEPTRVPSATPTAVEPSATPEVVDTPEIEWAQIYLPGVIFEVDPGEE